MKLNKKVLSLFLVAIFAIVLVACDGTLTTDLTTEAPTTEVPTTEAPTTEAPTTEAPTTEAPTTEAPTTEEPTTEAPTTEAPTTVDLKPVLDALVANYDDTLGNDTFVAEDDLSTYVGGSLPSFVDSYYVTWFSSNTDYLGHDGSVTRPLLSEGDQTVIFTVTVSDGVSSVSEPFFVTVKALTEKTGEEIADEVFLVATAFPNKSLWSSADELTFLATADDLDGNTYDITWASSDETIIDLDGNITQPEDADTDVTITASITVNDEVFTKDIVFTVAKMAEGTPVTTIAAAVALGQDAYVEIQGVTVIAMYNSGDVFFTDGTDILYIYSPPFTAEIGGVYDITGLIDFYYNAPQLAGSDTNPLRLAASTEEVSVAPVITEATVDSVVANSSFPTEENPHQYLSYEVTAAVYFEESWGNYSVFLVPTDYDFNAALADGATQPNGDAIMVYYRSDMDVLKAFHGQVITIDIIMQGYRTDKSVYYANFFGTALDVDIDIADDAEAVSTALGALNFESPILEDITLLLPTELYGVTLTWTSTDNAVIDPTTGFVDVASLSTQVTVTLTVDASRGAETGQKVFELTVGELPVSDISDVVAASSGTFLVEGVLISGEYQNTYFIQDATGTIALYTNGSTVLEDILNDNLGNVLAITGSRASYHGLNQIAVDSIEFVEESTLPTPTDLSDVELTEANLADLQGQLVVLNTMVVSAVDVDNYGNITLTLTHLTNGTSIDFKWDSRVTLPTELNSALQSVSEGDVVNLVGILAWYDGPFGYIVTTSTIEEVTLTDAQKIAADKAALTYGGNLFVALNETLPLVGTNGSTIAWAITSDPDSNATLDAVTGAFSIAAPTATATVELTATLTLGSDTDTAVFTWTLLAVTAVDLGDFTAQALDSTVAISGVVYAVTSNGFFVEDATGQIFVFDYDATYVIGDEVELIGTVAEYNGSYQLTDVLELAAPLSTGNDVSMEAVPYEHGVTVLEPGQLYTVFGTVALEGQYNNVFIYVNETDSFEIYYRSPAASIDELEALVGEMVAVQIIYYNNDTSFVYDNGVGSVQLYAEVTDFSELFAMTNGTDYDLANDTLIKLTGVVTGNSYDGLFIQDANGVGFFMYRPDETGINVGDEVVYLGELTDYNGARQLAYGAALLEVVSTGNALVVTPTTADAIDAFGMNEAGTLFSFDGFTFQGLDGSHMLLGYTLSDGITTGTVKVRYYSNWDDLSAVADNYAVDDVLPVVNFILYNFRDGEIQLDVVDVEFTEQNLLDFDVASIDDPLELSEDLVIPTGDFGTTFTVTAQSVSLDGYVDFTTTAGTLLVTQPAIGAADVTGTLTVTATNGVTTQEITINVTVLAEVAALVGTVETFDNLALSGTSYAAGSFVGVDGITWAYTESRGDFTLDGQAIMLDKNGDGSSLSATISGGIGSFSVEYFDAYGGAAQVELWINGTLVATSLSVDFDGSGDTALFLVEDINITGDITIEILAAGAQMVLDNLTWSSYAGQ